MAAEVETSAGGGSICLFQLAQGHIQVQLPELGEILLSAQLSAPVLCSVCSIVPSRRPYLVWALRFNFAYMVSVDCCTCYDRY